MNRVPVDAAAGATTAALCLVWSLAPIAVRLSADDIPPVLQGSLRSIVAVTLLVAWARHRSLDLSWRDSFRGAGSLAGLMFTLEFLFVYLGLGLTGASRMTVIVYLGPCLTAAALHFFEPNERLTRLGWLGVWLGFLGIVLAFGGATAHTRSSLLGDAFGLLAAIFWAATNVVIRTTALASAPAAATQFYQLLFSAIVLPAASVLVGESWNVRVSALALACLLYQSVMVAFASYLVWFGLLTRFHTSQLVVFTFLTPIFGIAGSSLILGERIEISLVLAATMVAAGIVLTVNGNFRQDPHVVRP